MQNVSIPQYPRNGIFKEVDGLFEQTLYRDADIKTLQAKIKAGLHQLRSKIESYKGPNKAQAANNYNVLISKYERLIAALDNIISYDAILRSDIVNWNLGNFLEGDKPIVSPQTIHKNEPTPQTKKEDKAPDPPPVIMSEPVMTPNDLKIEGATVVKENSNGIAENGKQ